MDRHSIAVVAAVALFGLAHAGCGYAFVRADAGGPAPVVSVGLVRDLSTEGDLGERLARDLRTRLAARKTPRLAGPGDSVPRLEGVLTPLPDRTVAFDAFGALFEVRLRARLDLFASTTADHRTPWPLWSSGDVERSAVYARGATPVSTDANRRLALESVVAALSVDLLDRFVSSPEVSP